MQHLVQELQRSVQVDLQPAGGVLDALTGVITAPTFNKAQTHNTHPAQVVHAQTRCRAQTWGEGRQTMNINPGCLVGLLQLVRVCDRTPAELFM